MLFTLTIPYDRAHRTVTHFLLVDGGSGASNISTSANQHASALSNAHKPMNEILKRLDLLLQQKRPKYFASLSPGISVDELQQFETELGLPIDTRLKRLYLWRNGQDQHAEGYFQNYRSFMAFQRVITVHAQLSALLDERGIAFHMRDWWNRAWIPFLEGPCPDYLCVDTHGSFGGHSGQVLNHLYNDPLRQIIAPDLDSWLKSYCDLLADDKLDEYGNVIGSDVYVWIAGVPGYPISATAEDAEREH